MKKRVFVVHGWEGYPEEGWRPWLKKKLEEEDFAVHIPEMPDTAHPKQQPWISHITKIVGETDTACYFVGHSLGCIAILRYLEQLAPDKKVGGVIMVAGFDNDLGVSELSDFFTTQIYWEKISSHCEKFISIESDNDPYNLLPYNEVFRKKLGAETIVMHDMKHFSGDDGITELPIVYDKLVALAKS